MIKIKNSLFCLFYMSGTLNFPQIFFKFYKILLGDLATINSQSFNFIQAAVLEQKYPKSSFLMILDGHIAQVIDAIKNSPRISEMLSLLSSSAFFLG